MIQNHLTNGRIVHHAQVLLDFLATIIQRQGIAVNTLTRHCINRVCDSDDTGSNRNIFTLQAFRITATIVTFMVMQHNLHQFMGVIGLHQNLGTNHRMLLNNREFVIRKLTRLAEHVIANTHLADIVQMCSMSNQRDRTFRKAQQPSDLF